MRRNSRHSHLTAAVLLAIAAGLWTQADGPRAQSDRAARSTVWVAPIEGMIDLGLAPFVERVLETAQRERAAYVILEVNTHGGRVDAAVVIRDQLLRAQVPTVAFVNKRAISAGALITLAAEKVAMARGGTIGAAAPIQLGPTGEDSKPASEKTVSYVRKEFRATADARKRNGPIAEAMVDPDVEIPGVIEKGKLLTLTTEDAIRHKIADIEADDLDGVLTALGIPDAQVHRVGENWAEQLVRFLTHPIVASLLMSLGMLGILVELRTPGFGLPGLIGILSLSAFFWGHMLVELAGWEQLMMVAAGVVLLVLEIFVLPGFGVAGLLGAAALVLGLSSSLFGAGATVASILVALSRVLIASAIAVVAALLLFRLLPRLPGGRSLVLSAALPGAQPSSALEHRTLLGVVGTTLTPLRPSGLASLDGQRVDVVSQGEYIPAGESIVVLREEGSRVVVAQHRVDNVSGGPA